MVPRHGNLAGGLTRLPVFTWNVRYFGKLLPHWCPDMTGWANLSGACTAWFRSWSRLLCNVVWRNQHHTSCREGDSVWNWNQFAPCIGGPCSYLLVKPGPERGNYMIQYTVVTALLSYWSLSLSLSSPWYLVYLRVGACHGLYRHSTLIKSEYNSDWIGIFCDIFPLSRPNDPANNDGNTSFLDWTQFFVPHR